MSKKKIILMVIISLAFIGGLIAIYYLTENSEEFKVTGTVVISSNDYVVLESDEDNYLVKDVKNSYEVGDEVLFTYLKKSLDDTKQLLEITAIDEKIIKAAKKDIKTENIDDLEEQEGQDNEVVIDSEVIKEEETQVFSDNTVDATEKQNNDVSVSKEIVDIKEDEALTEKKEENKKEDIREYVPKEEVIVSDSLTKEEVVSKSADEEVLAYVNSLESDIDQGITSTLKNGFITIVDFLFYDGEIAGHTFSELTTRAKLEVLKAALWVDDKVDNIFPGYKETISNGANKAYNSVKNLIVSTYLDITSSICHNNSDLCESAKRDFQSLKDSFGFTWDLIKGLASSGLDKLASWYEIWSGK